MKTRARFALFHAPQIRRASAADKDKGKDEEDEAEYMRKEGRWGGGGRKG